jgi:L-asparaginase
MAGARATPALDADALLAAIPQLAHVRGLRARSVLALPGAHLSAADALAIARAALAETEAGRGVVVTHGTDTLEETAVLCDVLHGRPEPIVLTGAIRPSSTPGADGPANLLDAVAVAGAPQVQGLGVLVVFAGEVHAARAVRKVSSISPAAFGSPATGPLGTVAEGRVRIAARPLRPATALPAPDALDARVPIVPTYLGDDGSGLRAAVRDGADAIVFVALGVAGRLAVAAGGADDPPRCPRERRAARDAGGGAGALSARAWRRPPTAPEWPIARCGDYAGQLHLRDQYDSRAWGRE